MFQPFDPPLDPSAPRRQVTLRPARTEPWVRASASEFIELSRGEQRMWLLVWDYLTNRALGPTDIHRPEMFAFRVDNAEILARSRCILAPDSTMLIEGITHTDSFAWRSLAEHCDQASLRKCFKQFHRTGAGELDAALLEPSCIIDQEAILIGGSENFGHFLYQSLFLAQIAASIPRLRDLPLVVSEKMPRRYFDFLELVGFPRERIIEVSIAESQRCARLWVITLPIHRRNDMGIVVTDGNISQNMAAIKTMAWPEGVARFRAAVSTLAGRPPRRRRIYIPRQREAYRRIINENEIIARLAPLGFEAIDLSDYSAREQFGIITSAEIIIGAIGAGMSMSLLAPGDCAVVQLTGMSMYGLYNSHIPCLLTQQPFVELIGTFVPDAENAQRKPLYRDFSIDADAVENAARILLE